MPRTINWADLRLLANKLAESGMGPGNVPETEWFSIERTLQQLLVNEDWTGIIQLRHIFTPLFARDTTTGLSLLQRLDNEAIKAAELLKDKNNLALLLGAKGHNLHRQGFHRKSIGVFERSAEVYTELGDTFSALKSYYMTSLCYRALGNRTKSYEILTHVLDQLEENDPWRGQPLQVLAWLSQDEGQLSQAEQLLRSALRLQRQASDSDILVAGTLADLGEIVGLQGDLEDAKEMFQESLAILHKHKGQYDRQEARTKLKFAELLLRHNQNVQALHLLNQADDLVRVYGHYYDLLWRIELAKAIIFLKQGRWRYAFQKLRSVYNYRQTLRLSNIMLVKQLLRRFRDGTGLPR